MTSRPISNVRGRSFAGAQLASAALAGEDVRGTDFTGADLHDADLSNIRAGMSRGWAAWLVLGSLAISIALGVLIGACARYLGAIYTSGDVRGRMAVLYVISALLVFLVAGIWKGLRYATYQVLPVTAALAVAAALSAVVSGAGTGLVALLTIVFLALAVVVVTLAVLVRATAGTAGKLAFALVAISGALAAGAAGGGLFATAIAISAMVMARRTARIEALYPGLARATAAIACRGGTRFRDADLRGANFEHARLFACDFRGAKLDGAHLDHATMQLCRGAH
jgi:hypothetical protein